MNMTDEEAARRLERTLHAALGRPDTPQDAAIAQRVMGRIASGSLPPQRRPALTRWWPTALLDVDLTPAWPRLAALAGAGALGVALGLFGATLGGLDQRSVAAPVETDLVALVFDPEPVTGVRP